MAKQESILTLLARIERDLGAAAGYFENRGFPEYTEGLDRATDTVESIREDLEALREPVVTGKAA